MFADEYVEFVDNDKIMKFESTDEILAPPGYTIAKHGDHIVFYKIERNELFIMAIENTPMNYRFRKSPNASELTINCM